MTMFVLSIFYSISTVQYSISTVMQFTLHTGIKSVEYIQHIFKIVQFALQLVEQIAAVKAVNAFG